MAGDLKFDEIIEELQRIHTEHPDLRFGEVMQVAVDTFMMSKNKNFNDLSSKKTLACLKDFHRRTTEQRAKGKKPKKPKEE